MLWNSEKFQNLEKPPGVYTLYYVTPPALSEAALHDQTPECFLHRKFEHSPPSGIIDSSQFQ